MLSIQQGSVNNTNAVNNFGAMQRRMMKDAKASEPAPSQTQDHASLSSGATAILDAEKKAQAALGRGVEAYGQLPEKDQKQLGQLIQARLDASGGKNLSESDANDIRAQVAGEFSKQQLDMNPQYEFGHGDLGSVYAQLEDAAHDYQENRAVVTGSPVMGTRDTSEDQIGYGGVTYGDALNPQRGNYAANNPAPVPAGPQPVAVRDTSEDQIGYGGVTYGDALNPQRGNYAANNPVPAPTAPQPVPVRDTSEDQIGVGVTYGDVLPAPTRVAVRDTSEDQIGYGGVTYGDALNPQRGNYAANNPVPAPTAPQPVPVRDNDTFGG